jgi:hypothetical protein
LSRKIDLLGQKFERLTVIEDMGSNCRGHAMWKCQCDCGNIIEKVIGNDLRNGKTLSCGCYHKDVISKEEGYATFNRLFYSYKKGASLKGLDFEIDKEDFKILIKQNCYYCGREPKKEYIRKYMNGGTLFNGIDRIDSLKGYTYDNIVTCCSACNYAKRLMPQDEFFRWVKDVSLNLIKKGFIDPSQYGL